MGQPINDERLQELARQVVNALAAEYNKRYGSRIPVPVPMTFELELEKPKFAGTATTKHDVVNGVNVITSQSVEINMTLYRDNVREFLNVVLQHEVAHLKQKWDDFYAAAASQSHGFVWQKAMREMAQVPVATHKMDTTKAVQVYKEHRMKLAAAKRAAKKAADKKAREEANEE